METGYMYYYQLDFTRLPSYPLGRSVETRLKDALIEGLNPIQQFVIYVALVRHERVWATAL